MARREVRLRWRIYQNAEVGIRVANPKRWRWQPCWASWQYLPQNVTAAEFALADWPVGNNSDRPQIEKHSLGQASSRGRNGVPRSSSRALRSWSLLMLFLRRLRRLLSPRLHQGVSWEFLCLFSPTRFTGVEALFSACSRTTPALMQEPGSSQASLPMVPAITEARLENQSVGRQSRTLAMTGGCSPSSRTSWQ